MATYDDDDDVNDVRIKNETTRRDGSARDSFTRSNLTRVSPQIGDDACCRSDTASHMHYIEVLFIVHIQNI